MGESQPPTAVQRWSWYRCSISCKASHSLIFASCHPGAGSCLSTLEYRTGTRQRDPDFYQSSLEYDLQLLSLRAYPSYRSARSLDRHTPAAMAALPRPGTAVLDDWPDLEQYDELGRRMVLPDGIRATHNREPFFPTAGAWLLLAGCCQRGQYRGHIAWTCRPRRAHRPARSPFLAPIGGLGRQIQG